jgi:hypothetical protein
MVPLIFPAIYAIWEKARRISCECRHENAKMRLAKGEKSVYNVD